MQPRRSNNSESQHRREMKGIPKPQGNGLSYLLNCYKQIKDPDKIVNNLIRSAITTRDPEVIELAFSEVQKRLAYDAMSGDPFKKTSSGISTRGPDSQKIFLGEIRNGNKRPFLYGKDLLNQHMLVTGMTGTGKTSLLLSIIIQVILLSVNVLVFDYGKKDYRILKRIDDIKDLVVIPAKEFMINFLQVPPWVNPQEWAVIVINVFTKYFDLLSGSVSFLLNYLIELYKDYGVFKDSGIYPTFYDLFDKIRYSSVRGFRSSQIKDTVLSRIEVLLSLFGKAFSHSKAVHVDWIAANNCVFEMSALIESVARFYTAMIIMGIFAIRISTGMRGNILQNLVVMDESQSLFPKIGNYNIPRSPLSQILAQSREVGIGFILANQSTDLDPGVFQNTRCKVTFNLGNGDDIRKISKAMSLTPDQEAFIGRMSVGESIVKIPQEDPFAIKTMPMNIM